MKSISCFSIFQFKFTRFQSSNLIMIYTHLIVYEHNYYSCYLYTSIVFTGLPARGKTHISRRLARYLEFFHAIPVKLFDVATYRRKICGAIKDAAWFDITNEEGVAMRDMCNKRVLEDAFNFLEEHHNGVGNNNVLFAKNEYSFSVQCCL